MAGDTSSADPPAASRLEVEPQVLFPNFTWIDDAPTAPLHLNEHGVFQDAEGSWYIARYAHTQDDPTNIRPEDLYNNTRHKYVYSALGEGLYFGNHLPSINFKLLGQNKPNSLYVSRFDSKEASIFAAQAPLRETETGSATGKLVVRTAMNTAVLHPPKAVYRRVFGSAAAVVTKPAVEYRRGRTLTVGEDYVRPKWVVVRDLSRLSVVACANKT